MTTVTVEIDRDDIIPEILGTNWESWYWWKEVTYDEGYDWNKYPTDNNTPFLTVTILADDDDEDEEKTITKKLSVNDIARALVKSGYRKWNDLDAGQGDHIMQHTVFDEAGYI